MASKFRAASIHFNGKRQKFQTDGSVDYTHSGEAVVIEEGYENHTSAPIMSEIQMNSAVPVGGDGSIVDDAFIQQQEVEVTLSRVNGKLHTVKPCTITKLNYSWDHKNATQVRNMTLSGGKPKITG